jgi:hypothetical protein
MGQGKKIDIKEQWSSWKNKYMTNWNWRINLKKNNMWQIEIKGLNWK